MKPIFPVFVFLTTTLSLGLGGCSRGGPAMTSDGAISSALPSGATAAAPAPETPLLPPLGGEWLSKMPLSKGRQAYVAIPLGAREKRAIVVGVHGAGDRADWSCSEWQATTANWAFVVCPQGVPHPSAGTYVWGSAASIAAEADEAVAELRKRYADYLDDGPLIYGGWSQGATLAGQVIASRPGVYDRAVLVEVGHTPLDAGAVVAQLEKGGIRRAVVSCSSANCRGWAKGFERAATREGLPVRINDVGNRGHVFDGRVASTLGPLLSWMVDDQARFVGLGAAVDARYSTD